MLPLDQSVVNGSESAGQCGSYGDANSRPLQRRQILPPWYCINVHPHMETLAIKHLHHQGFETFMPVMMQLVGRKNKQKLEERPLFPGYLFASFDIRYDPWYQILSTMGVKHLFRDAAGWPQQLHSRIISLCREQTLQQPQEMLPTPTQDNIEPGESITILDGPWTGFTAICKLSEKDRVTVLLSLLGHQTSVQFARHSVKKA